MSSVTKDRHLMENEGHHGDPGGLVLRIPFHAAVMGLAAVVSMLTSGALSGATEKDIFGWAEHILVGRSQLEMEAKLDTGADTSSIDASRIRRFRTADKKRWVEFRLTDQDTGRTVRYKKRLVRYVYIKEHEGPSQKRPVVKMQICVGDHPMEIEMSLVDRSDFDFPVLLGRNALQGLIVVDSELEYTSRPSCPAEAEP
jgi:hypothetical protein